MLDAYVVNVFDEVAGSELSADASAAATTISVVDLTDFNLDPEGGSLKLDDGTNNETLTYTVPSGSTGTINLGAGLANSYLTGTKVTILVNGLPVIERWADLREPDGEELLRTLVPQQLRALIPTGPRDEDAGEAEHVKADFEDEDLVIQNVLGKTVTGIDLEAAGRTTPPDQDKVRWVRRDDGVLVAAIWGYETPSSDALVLSAYEAPGAVKNPIVELLTTNQDGTLANLSLRGAPNAKLQVNIDGNVKTILDQVGASDFELATSGGWQNWTPTLGGWALNPTGGIYRYTQTGKTVQLMIRQPNTGTSIATFKTISLPVTAATITNAIWSAPAAVTDNGVGLTTPGRGAITSGSTTISFLTDWSLGAFTNAGAASIREFQITYEAA